jgi:two-component system sensor histidine kinase VicK
MASTPFYPNINSRSAEITQIFYGVETVVNTVLQFLKQTDNEIDACVDQTRPSLTIEIAKLKEAFIDAKKRGVKLRYITEITKDNLSYCKQLLTMVEELRHLDGIKGNLYLNSREYLAPATFHEKGKPAAQIIYSNVKELVGHQRYVFDTLWTRSISAEQRIEQIEEGVENEFFQVITNQKKTSQILTELVKSIKKEALIFLPDDKAMVRIDKLGIINYIIRASRENEATIKIICPLTEDNSEIVNRITKNAPAITILNGNNNSAFDMYIIDDEKLLRSEIREMNTDDFLEAVDFAIYSNRKLTVNSFKSVYDLLWNERISFEQLKVQDKMQKDFINIAAHELRTPIQSILGFSELLKDRPENIEVFTDRIIKSANRLQKLSNDILDVTRIENKQLKLDLERFNLTDLIADIIIDFKNNNPISNKEDTYSGHSQTEQLDFVYEAEEEGTIFVEADKERIAGVICNLLTNAIKFTRGGLISIKCYREYQDNDETNNHYENAIVSIKDTGSGITPDIMPRLFSKFATNSTSGTGLGLFISKNIVEAHGGKIWAENNRDQRGASFSFSLPIRILNQYDYR